MTRILFVVAALAVSSTAASAQAVKVTLSEWKVVAAPDTVRAGAVTFQVNNIGAMRHALYILGDSVDKGTRDIPARQTATLTVTLKPGTYELFCPMSEETHKKAGMSRKLVVTAGSPPAVPAKPEH